MYEFNVHRHKQINYSIENEMHTKPWEMIENAIKKVQFAHDRKSARHKNAIKPSILAQKQAYAMYVWAEWREKFFQFK